MRYILLLGGREGEWEGEQEAVTTNPTHMQQYKGCPAPISKSSFLMEKWEEFSRGGWS